MRTPSKPHHLHGIRVVLFAFSLVALCLVRVDVQLAAPTVSNQGAVLAYAVNTSRGDLLAYTNEARAQNGHSDRPRCKRLAQPLGQRHNAIFAHIVCRISTA